MEIYIRKLDETDLTNIQNLATEKLHETNTPDYVFKDSNDLVFKFFVLPKDVYGHDKLKCFGYFKDNELIAILGIRCIGDTPSWVLSFIVTSIHCKNSISVIKKLMAYTITHQEELGFYQWYIISKLEKFDAWQRLFKDVRKNYHHYVYARVPANTLPKWLDNLQLSNGKLFPYDINISMYMSKLLCTSDESHIFNEQDLIFF